MLDHFWNCKLRLEGQVHVFNSLYSAIIGLLNYMQWSESSL